MHCNRHKNTYGLLTAFAILFLVLSFILRTILVFISYPKAALSLLSFFRIFGMGLLFDLGLVAFFVLPYTVYLLFVPVSKNNSKVNRFLTYGGFFLSLLIIVLSFFAEFTFWTEFESRFNFIAVDYLIYTYEVVNNINESYPLPLLISGVMLICIVIVYLFYKAKYFERTFNGKTGFTRRLAVFVLTGSICLLYCFKIDSNFAEAGKNRYQDELSKAGIYSFFSAYKNNELSYDNFYETINNDTAFAIVRSQINDSGNIFIQQRRSIERNIISNAQNRTPNVIMVTMESFSADFMNRFGNKNNLTPVLDSLASESILFTKMYATGTRTVRGMEALTLAIPPTPGSSIVRRPDNADLTTVGSIFQQKGYETGFFYGGDGYFDNMNNYFGNNGYSITDKGRNLVVRDKLAAPRTTIPSRFVRFENAWGICDEDLYDAVIKDADKKHVEGKKFYDFVMLTSNHRPYTYPSGLIDIPSGSGRNGAVKYTDYAVGKFLEKAKKKPWFKNTVFIFVADHCASSAGKNEIDVSKYHIPAMIYNLDNKLSGLSLDKLCSQIDLYPTLFGFFGWSYTSNLYGKDITQTNYEPRAFLGTYQKLGYLKNDSLVILSPQKKIEIFKYMWQSNEQIIALPNNQLVGEAIANYQTAYWLYKNGGLKLRKMESHR